MTTHHRARAVIGDTAPLEKAQQYLQRFDDCRRRGIPERPLLVCLHGTETSQAIAAVKQWLTGGGLYVLAGPGGGGKSVAAAWWAARRNATWVPASQAGDFKIQDQLATASALVIDDLGAQGSTGDVVVQRIAATLLDRHANGLASLITSNLSRKDLGDLLDGDHRRSRLLDRTDEDGGLVVITERLRGKDTPPSWKRIEEANALVGLWRKVEQVAVGQREDAGETAKLQALLGLTEVGIENALAMQTRIVESLDKIAAGVPLQQVLADSGIEVAS
jgi:hypothetical protein